ncbi:MFS transporter [Orbaceae bacterium ESL0721]|nr:MFS transporter [Orbaceae bacterium ESL0721]
MTNQQVHSYGIVGSIYANYIMQSIALIIIMQFSTDLSKQLNTDIIGIGYVASGIGIGKILLMFVGGILSDKFGRKPFIYIGMLCYITFFLGILQCTNIHQAFFLAMIVGAGNSFLDTGSMPTLTECFPHSAGSASILIKAFISFGSLILPFIVTFIDGNQIWYGWAMISFSLFLLINGILLAPKKFPAKNSVMTSDGGEVDYFISKPKFGFEGVLLLLMGFTTTATFAVILQWLPEIAHQGVGMAQDPSKQLISYYSIASILSVFFTSYIVKKLLQPVYCIVILPLLSALFLLLFFLFLTPTMCVIAAIGIGFTAAGGVLQLTLVVMQQLFPKRKGLAVGSVYTLSGIAYILVPSIIPKLTIINVSYAILVDLVIAICSVIFGALVCYRFTKVIDMKKI